MVKALLRGLIAPAAAIPLLCLSPAAAHASEALPLAEAVTRLPLGTESREGYDRDLFRRWNTGDDPADSCNTRAEVLLDEALAPPIVGASCRLTGGLWWSYFDAPASNLDIDHMVPLAGTGTPAPSPGRAGAARPA
ncbi:hypothetical protein ACH3WN_15615 [Streptomyces albogriseolus]|uniref:hypothetical protein n=1 Tax=Streptomyces albogriseolus TaxID=1887 RepID=UPI003792674C